MEMLMKCPIYKLEFDIEKSQFAYKKNPKQTTKRKHKHWNKSKTLTAPLVICK